MANDVLAPFDARSLGLVQERCNSSVNALDLHLSCTNRSNSGMVQTSVALPQLLEDPSFIPITSLEMDGGQPQQFHTVLTAMQEQRTGDTVITEHARRAISLHNSLLWRPVEYAHYFYTDIPGKQTKVQVQLCFVGCPLWQSWMGT